jgi:hypothetical protein
VPLLNVDLLGILLLILSAGFFVRSARREMRSPLLWGGLSVALWLLFANLIDAGLSGGLLSQLLLLVGLNGWEMLRERSAKR